MLCHVSGFGTVIGASIVAVASQAISAFGVVKSKFDSEVGEVSIAVPAFNGAAPVGFDLLRVVLTKLVALLVHCRLQLQDRAARGSIGVVTESATDLQQPILFRFAGAFDVDEPELAIDPHSKIPHPGDTIRFRPTEGLRVHVFGCVRLLPSIKGLNALRNIVLQAAGMLGPNRDGFASHQLIAVLLCQLAAIRRIQEYCQVRVAKAWLQVQVAQNL